jgi:thioredoxin-related protein
MLRMIRPRILLAGAFLLALAAVAPAQGITWAKGFDSARAMASKSNKLIMVDFWTTWCGYCKQMDATTMKDKKVIEKSRLLVPVKVNAEAEGTPLARRYQVNSFPTFLFIDSNGNEFGRAAGAMAPEQFMAAISDMNARFKDFQSATARVKRNPKDGEAQALLASVNAARGSADQADAQAAKAASLGFKGPKLAQAFVNLGDYHRIKRKQAKAITYYQKSLTAKGSPRDAAYAHFAIAALSADIGKTADAKKHVNLAIQTKGAPKEIVDAAKRLQAYLAKG